MKTPKVMALAIVAGALLLWSGAAVAQTLDLPLRLTAFAVNMGSVGRGGANTVSIQIDRWSTEEERELLMTTFVEKGPDALLSALQKQKRVGFMRLPNTMGYDLQFARLIPNEEGGSRIILATDRKIGFQEARNQPRTMDYPFTLLEIRLDKNGEGQGKMSVATKITLNKNTKTIELENYSSEPVRLTSVKVEKKK
jgi:hypothetical protein